MEHEGDSEASEMIALDEEPVSAIRARPTYPAACEDNPDYTVDAQFDL